MSRWALPSPVPAGASPLSLVVVAIVAVASSLTLAADDKKTEPPKPLNFEADVAPILKARCWRCHAGAEPKAGLDLTRRNALLLGGDSGAAIRLRAAESSLLWERLANDEMPAGGPPLSAKEKGVIRTWINEGAVSTSNDPAVQAAVDEAAAEGDPWAFLPPRPPPIPRLDANTGGRQMRNPVDAFVQQKLSTYGLEFAPDASRATLIRRVYFDLLGLPPSPDEVAEFLADPRPDAYEQLVERLLASPHYGERWGRHWLDVAGYADSAGILSEDRPLPLAFRYRDYVIAAFNEDKPYDRFLLEQIAGDELTDYWSAYDQLDRLPDHVVEGLIATGYLRTAADPSRPDFNTIKNAAAQYYYPTLNDTLKIVASSTLGLTVQCAKCHSHKFDPITQEEYYRLQAVFSSAYRPAAWIPQMNRRVFQATAKQKRIIDQRNQEVEQAVALANKAIARLKAEYGKRYLDARIAELPGPIREDVRGAIATEAKARNEVQKYLAEKFGSLQPKPEQLEKLLSTAHPEFAKQKQKLDEQIAAQQRRRMYVDEIRALYDQPGDAPTPFLIRGDPLTPGHLVTPGVPAVLRTTTAFRWEPPPPDSKTSGRRLAFARWLTQPDHPLTARVMANRIWLHHFGEGIVATPDDFGAAGAPPSHADLLDWLAREFVGRDWSIKHLHRLILQSTTYRQGSRATPAQRKLALDADPANRLLWRQRMRRLEAEPMRDAMLAAAGQLDERLFGHAIPMQRHATGEVTTLKGRNGNRRSIYLQVLRLTPLTMMQVFDQPQMETNCVRRGESTVSLQALTLLNSDASVAAAKAIAERVVSESPVDPIARTVSLLFARQVTADERVLLSEFLERQTDRHAGQQPPIDAEQARRAAMSDLCHMLMSSNEFLFID